jgi:hypothetical protein
MTRSTTTKQRLVAIALAAGALAISVPVAQAQSPDAFERAVNSHEANPTFTGSPDAIDRAVAARQADKLAAIDARERGVERPAHQSVAPDAFERALITHTDAMTSQTAAMLDSRERALSERPTSSSPLLVAASGGFDWSDFSVGAGTGIGLVLLLLGLGVLAIRRSHERVTTA